MVTFAEVSLVPDGILAWGVVGLLVGFFAGVVLDPGWCGVVADTAAALAGAALGGALFGFFVGGTAGFWGSIPTAFVGACVWVAGLRAISPAAKRF